MPLRRRHRCQAAILLPRAFYARLSGYDDCVRQEHQCHRRHQRTGAMVTAPNVGTPEGSSPGRHEGRESSIPTPDRDEVAYAASFLSKARPTPSWLPSPVSGKRVHLCPRLGLPAEQERGLTSSSYGVNMPRHLALGSAQGGAACSSVHGHVPPAPSLVLSKARVHMYTCTEWQLGDSLNPR